MKIEEYLLICLIFTVVFAIHSFVDACTSQRTTQINAKTDWAIHQPVDLLNVKIVTTRRHNKFGLAC
jgi:hypothetical protein